jgi:GntR family transcriptional regulator, arabinose operon transcriptional repressor
MPRKKTQYERIVDDIRKEIAQGALKKDDRIPSEIELAGKYGVSRVTSRRALQELEAEDLVYRRQGSGSYVTGVFPSTAGSSDGSRRLISLLIPFSANTGRSIDILHGASDFLNTRGYFLTVQLTDDNAAKERAILQAIEGTAMAGYLFYPETDQANSDVIYQLDCVPVPLVTIDKYFEGTSLPSVVSDNYAGARQAVQHLLSLGHREIGFVADIGLNDATTVRDRYRGYCSALRDAGVRTQMRNVVVDHTRRFIRLQEAWRSDAAASDAPPPVFRTRLGSMLEPLVSRPDPVTALFCLNDGLALHLLRFIPQLGLKVPDDISLVGFDNLEMSNQIDVPLTTVEQDFYGMGREAARLLVARIEGAPGTADDRIVMPTRLIIRKSTAALGTP